MTQTRKLVRNALDAITNEKEFSGQSKKILSVIFLLVSFLLSFQSIAGTRLFFFPKDISISPDLLSATIALALIIPLYGRGILKWSPSIHGLIMFVLLLAVFFVDFKTSLRWWGRCFSLFDSYRRCSIMAWCTCNFWYGLGACFSRFSLLRNYDFSRNGKYRVCFHCNFFFGSSNAHQLKPCWNC